MISKYRIDSVDSVPFNVSKKHATSEFRLLSASMLEQSRE